jgi:hypothetical protein
MDPDIAFTTRRLLIASKAFFNGVQVTGLFTATTV